jgi:stalled ribosome rescue protein Dom34
MKNIGIWLDKEKAHIVTLENGNETMNTVRSEVEDYHIHGGSGTRFKGGPQDVVQDSKYLEREKHQLKLYFKEIASEVKDASALVIFGPAEAKDKLNKELQKKYKNLSAKVRAVIVADSMTENQMKALARDFFKSKEK